MPLFPDELKTGSSKGHWSFRHKHGWEEKQGWENTEVLLMLLIKLWNLKKKDLSDDLSFKGVVRKWKMKIKCFIIIVLIKWPLTKLVEVLSTFLFKITKCQLRRTVYSQHTCPGLIRFPQPISCSWRAQADDDNRSVNHFPTRQS